MRYRRRSFGWVVGPRDPKTGLACVACLLLSMPLVLLTDSASLLLRYAAYAGIAGLWAAVLVLTYVGDKRARRRRRDESAEQ